MRKKILVALFLSFLLSFDLMAEDRNTGIIPEPAQVEWAEGILTVPSEISFSTKVPDKEQGDISEWMNRMSGTLSPFRFKQVKSTKNPLLTLKITGEGPAESYELKIGGKGITINAADKAGIFYGLQSLSQLAAHFSMQIPLMTIKDQPRFEYRGLMIDPSRNFRSLDFIKKQLDMMAYYKLNRFHWHLSDDSGWRIEIKKYPQLTEQAAYYPYPNLETWWKGGMRYCKKDDPKATGGFYTQEEVKELVEYARKLNITVIPEIDLPGHSAASLAIFPEMSCSGVPGSNIYCVGNEQAFTFLEDVFTEIIELFPSQYIHVGGDEVSKDVWSACGKCQQRMKDENLKDVNELQSYIIKRIDKFLTEKGRNLIGWDEILDGGLAPGATVMSWRGEAGGIEASRQGKKAIMTPESYCYIDGAQDDPTKEPFSSGYYLPIERVYSYNPAPESLGSDVAKNILGVQANVWSEWIDTDLHMERMIWPRTIAIAETGWSPDHKKSYKRFRANALEAVERLKKLGYAPFDLKNEKGERSEFFDKLNTLSTGKKIVYPETDHIVPNISGLTDGSQGGWNIGTNWIIQRGNTDFVVDLGEIQPIKLIRICFIQPTFPRNVFLPDGVEIMISDDNRNYTSIREISNDVPGDKRQNVYEKFSWYGNLDTRYVRIKVTAPNKNYGADEIIVR